MSSCPIDFIKKLKIICEGFKSTEECPVIEIFLIAILSWESSSLCPRLMHGIGTD